MADINLKTETPDTSLPTTGFLFGADSQAASAPSVYTTQAVATTLLGSTSLTGATITADAPVLNMSQTWNNAAVTFTGLKFNATDTASAAASLLLDIGTGGGTYVSKFSVSKIGYVTAASGFVSVSSSAGSFFPGGVYISSNSGVLALGSSSNAILSWRAAANLRLGAADTTGTTAPTPQFLSAQSWASSTTNNQTGANFTIDGSQGTGTGAGGSIIFRVAPAGATSNGVQNALATALTINSSRQLLAIDGTNSLPSYSFASDATSGLYLSGANLVYSYSGTARAAFTIRSGIVGFTVPDAGAFVFSSTSSPLAAGDVFLFRDTSNTLALRNGANAQTFNLYQTYTDGSNYSRLSTYYEAGIAGFAIKSEAAGTGTARSFFIGTGVAAGGVYIRTNGLGNDGWRFSGSGASQALLCETDNSFDIGAVSATRPRSVYAGTSITPGRGVTVAGLPTPSTGMIARVTDATAPVIGATVAGGGAAYALVNYNGANWTVIGV